MTLFKGIGVLVFIYTLYAVYTGEVFARDKWTGRMFRKADEPKYYWAVIVIYFGLSIACYFFF